MQAFHQFKQLFQDSNAREEARLIAAAKTGSERAFDRLMSRNEEALRRYILSQVGRDASEDVLQETRVAAWMTLDRFAGRSRYRAWLFGIAYFKCQDYHRGRQGSDRREVAMEEAALERPDPRDPFATADMKMMARSVLENLPQPQREVMELYYYGGLTLLEVATVLGRGVNTVKSQFYRAHSRAVEILHEGRSRPQSEMGYLMAKEKPAP
ncbi:MAG: RNA polymerase sigma factor [Armatimonadaceae bacterium]